jgi:thiamine transport system ATP-binding protein
VADRTQIAGARAGEPVKPILKVEGVTFRYEDMLMAFDLAVEPGEFLAVMGPSGAGKSTLLSLIAGFEKPLEGQVLWEGLDITQLAPAERPLSILFQENNLFAHLDVYTNAALGISPSAKLQAEDRTRVMKALARVGLGDMEARLPGELSGGERQRAALARMLVRRKPLLLLDEPFAALGPALKKEMIGLVRELHREQGFTILLVTHEPADAKAAASHTAFIHEGKILAKRRTPELFKSRDIPELLDYLGE